MNPLPIIIHRVMSACISWGISVIDGENKAHARQANMTPLAILDIQGGVGLPIWDIPTLITGFDSAAGSMIM